MTSYDHQRLHRVVGVPRKPPKLHLPALPPLSIHARNVKAKITAPPVWQDGYSMSFAIAEYHSPTGLRRRGSLPFSASHR